MATTKPNYKDIIDRIPRVRVSTIQRRDLSEIQHQVAHYEAGGNIPSSWTIEQEIQHLIDVALFHHNRDFGGAKGRTLEYTYALLPSGRIYLVNPETYVVWSHKNGNRVGMSTLCCLGVGQEPTQAMLATLTQHWDYCSERADVNIDKRRSWGHGETQQVYGSGPAWGNNTVCPEKVLPFVRAYRARATIPVPDPTLNTEYFPQTGHNLSNAFRDYWKANGGLARFGFPLTEEQAGNAYPYTLLPELATFTVQMFERALLHWRADQGVGEGRIGALVEALQADGAADCACEAA